jgi:hypothetical protein
MGIVMTLLLKPVVALMAAMLLSVRSVFRLVGVFIVMLFVACVIVAWMREQVLAIFRVSFILSIGVVLCTGGFQAIITAHGVVVVVRVLDGDQYGKFNGFVVCGGGAVVALASQAWTESEVSGLGTPSFF